MANIVIDIAAEFVGKNAFKQAETSTDKLSKGVKNLAKTIGVAFSVQQVIAFGKASVQAAAADEKAQKQLALALKNVGLGRDVAASEDFIQKLQSEFGVLDDKLRPAYQQLAVATQNTAQSQKLLQIALDISASTGRDLASVTGAISKAYLGNNTALGKLGVGISKADLKAKSFDEIMNDLASTFAGSATASANTFQGSMDKLAVASANVQEIIGKGLIDSFTLLAGDGGIGQAIVAMEEFGVTAANVLVGTASYVDKLLKAFSGGGGSSGPKLGNLSSLLLPFLGQGGILDILGTEGAKIAAQGQSSSTALAHLAELQANYTIITLSTKKKLTAEELKALAAAQKTLAAKKLSAAIDKANRALGKGTGVFDLDKIQLAAAEKAAAEQLGKATSEAQLLAITNDLARLQVKEDMLALEDAIASKDVAAIAAATAKLNGDLLILGALTNQEVKLLDIEEILAALLPKELIDLANLDEAIAKLIALSKIVINPVVPVAPGTPGTPTIPPVLTEAEINENLKKGLFPPSGGKGGSSNAGDYPSKGFPGADIPFYEAFDPARSGMTSGGSRPTQSNNNTTVTITVNESLDPNLTATRIQKILTDAANNTGNVYDLGTGSKNTSYVV